MSLDLSYSREEASARAARLLASPKTALAGLTPEEVALPAAQEIVQLAPGATIPEQEPPPASPGKKRYTTGSYGKTIPISLGRRRLAGTVIQSSALVPRLVGNREYEVTYQLPPEPEPETEINEGDPPIKGKTIWCFDCNCFYCYVGPIGIRRDTGSEIVYDNVPLDLDDKATWPYMAMMGTYESRLCTEYAYNRMHSVSNEIAYGAVMGNAFGTWLWEPQPTEDDFLPLTCGPCKVEAAYPDSVAGDMTVFGTRQQDTASRPHSAFLYMGIMQADISRCGDFNQLEWRPQVQFAGFFKEVISPMADNIKTMEDASESGLFSEMKIFRIYYDYDDPDTETDTGYTALPDDCEDDPIPLKLPAGWKIWNDIGYGIDDIRGQELDIEDPNALRDWEKLHGGWAPMDEPSSPPVYRNGSTAFTTGWALGREFGSGDHNDVHCNDITDYSD